jgi:hypothetical protein
MFAVDERDHITDTEYAGGIWRSRCACGWSHGATDRDQVVWAAALHRRVAAGSAAEGAAAVAEAERLLREHPP